MAARKAKAEAQQAKRAEQRARAKEKELLEQEMAAFNGAIGKVCLESALDGQESYCISSDPREKFLKKLDDGGFHIEVLELTAEELCDNYPKIFDELGLSASDLNSDEDFDGDEDFDEDIELSVFRDSELYELHAYLKKIFEEGYDKINYMSPTQTTFFTRVASSRFAEVNQKSNTILVVMGLKDILNMLTKYQNYDFSNARPRYFRPEPEDAFYKLIGNISHIRDVLERHRNSEKVIKSKFTPSIFTDDRKRSIREDVYKIYEICWGAENDWDSFIQSDETDFFRAEVLEWIAYDVSEPPSFFESTFSFIEKSISKKYTSCVLDFEHYGEPDDELDHDQGLFSENKAIGMNIEQLFGVFKCLGYEVDLKKLKGPSKKDNGNLIARYELTLGWS